MAFKRVFRGGVSTPHHKNTLKSETSVLGTPEKVIIPMVQHIGAPCTPTVKKGDTVKVGQIIGNSDAYVSSPIHSSVSGTITRVEPMLYASGKLVMSIEIQTDGKQEVYEGISPPEVNNREDFLKAIRNSGLVGLGGAGFPTHVKLNPPKDKDVDSLIINGAECEPYITSDYREMIENPTGIIEGIQLVLDYLNINNAIIGIEDNKPDAIKLLAETSKSDKRISIKSLSSRYPQGAEKMLIYATTGRTVHLVNFLLMWVYCAKCKHCFIYSKYLKTGMPLVQRRVTVDGSVVSNPQNVSVPIGTSLRIYLTFVEDLSHSLIKC